MIYEDFEMVIGLEIHVRLNTKTKAFCGDANQYGNEANTNISPVSLAHPGTLPVINKTQIRKAIKLGLALGCSINQTNIFDRKHYFYPDLPKGYQLTQEKHPICIGGGVEIPSRSGTRTIRIHHIHMEEDAGKLIHSETEGSLVDHNRAGVPLLEVVTEPDLRSGQETYDFLADVIHLIEWLDISDANLEEGSLRCDCNVSIRKRGFESLGNRCEIKNLNSKKFARDAIEAEAKRQFQILANGGTILTQTMAYDPTQKVTYPIRSKESSHDYRYFPDPDLPALKIPDDYIVELEKEIHPLPKEIVSKLVDEFKLKEYEAEILSRSKEVVNYFLDLSVDSPDARLLSNVIINKIIPYIEDRGISILSFPLSKGKIISFQKSITTEEVSQTLAFQKLFPMMLEKQQLTVHQIIDMMDLRLTKDDNALATLVESILIDNASELKRYRSGKKALFGYFMGEAMKKSKGKFDPQSLKKELNNQLNDS